MIAFATSGGAEFLVGPWTTSGHACNVLFILQIYISSHLSQNACHKIVLKLRYKVIKEKTIVIFIFSVPKSQNSNEEEKNYITAKAY